MRKLTKSRRRIAGRSQKHARMTPRPWSCCRIFPHGIWKPNICTLVLGGFYGRFLQLPVGPDTNRRGSPDIGTLWTAPATWLQIRVRKVVRRVWYFGNKGVEGPCFLVKKERSCCGCGDHWAPCFLCQGIELHQDGQTEVPGILLVEVKTWWS